MHSVAAALVWEFWVRGRRWVVVAIAGMMGLVALLHLGRLLPGTPVVSEASMPPLTVYFNLLWPGLWTVIWVVAFALNEKRHGFPSRLFTAPVPTSVLVSYKMAIGGVAAALLYLILALLTNWLFDYRFPLLGPAYCFAAMLCCILAGNWSLRDFRVMKAIAASIVVASLGLWLFTRFHLDGWTKPARMWSTTTPLEWITMTAYIVAAWAFAVVEVGRDRCGTFRDWPDLQVWYEWLTSPLSRRDGKFRSPLGAQIWCEWRPRGLVVPGFFACLFVSIVGISIYSGVTSKGLWEPVTAFVLYLPFLAAAINGLFFGHRGNEIQLEVFDATRPLSDASLATAILRTATWSTFLAWLAGVLAAVLLIGWFSVTHGLNQTMYSLLESNGGRSWWAVCLFLGASLVAASTICRLVATLLLTGSGWLILTSFLFVAGMPLFGSFLVLVGWRSVVHVLVWSIWVAILVGAVGAFAVARRRDAISKSTVMGSAGVWLGLCAFCGWLSGWSFSAETVFCFSVLALPVLPQAAAPLAVGWNRHR